ncbi:thrombomodulin-like [Dendropsophus ebraccatus]|uniref:thrombomodulin-like n=1 Tax=Dendropsophus ebraccatus TaxID=150705 RepID=UPI0038316366
MQLYHFACSALILVQLTLQEELVPEFVCLDSKCYAVSWISKRFAKSRGACIERNADLMTVKSSMQGDAITRLMHNVLKEDTKVWIGLESKEACADLQQPLRGFTWVTGESDADYTNWRKVEQKCDASPLCVTVHKDGTWEETKCDNKADGYICEISYSLPCSPLVLPSSYTVTYYHLDLGMSHVQNSVFPPGTIANILDITELYCEPKDDGTVYWNKKTPGAWSCQINNGGCEHDCIVVVSGIAECKCPSGSELKADLRGCTKPCDPNPCSQQCIPSPDPPGFFCMCSEGYILAADGKTCEDIDDCADDHNICEHHCTNTIGGFICDCQPGFKMVDIACDAQNNCAKDCRDIDECESDVMCDHNCTNTEGSYKCVCNEGFVVDEKNPKKCKEICNKLNCEPYCPDPDKPCKCPHGYIMDQTEDGKMVCTDMDECATSTSPCDGLLCVNTLSSFICACPKGFTEYNGVCIQPVEATSDLPMATPPAIRPEEVFSKQTTIMWGICFGILSMFIVLIAMICHRIRRHYIYQHDLDYDYKNSDKDVVLKKIMVEPQWQL